MISILVLDPFHEDGLALLRARQDVKLTYLPTPTDEDIVAHIPKAEILLLRGRTVPVEQFRRAERLRMVSRHGVGCDNLDFDLLRAQGVWVAVSADANLVSVAEHAFMLMLAACKNVVVGDRAVRGGDWAVRDKLGAQDLQGARVLVLGFGRIGQVFAARAQAFGAHITIHDPFLPDGAPIPAGVDRATDLGDAIAVAGIVSIHMPLTKATANLFDADLLGRFSEGAVLVNTSRGGIVDEFALIGALDVGRPAIYATDVLADEPPRPENPLLARDDVILTPHSAATTRQGMIRMATGSAKNALDFLDGRLSAQMIALNPT